jgi:hypothetical protein
LQRLRAFSFFYSMVHAEKNPKSDSRLKVDNSKHRGYLHKWHQMRVMLSYDSW